MFSAGYVHRDISPGNILLFESNGQRAVRLADREYAKTFYNPNKDASHTPKAVCSVLQSLEVNPISESMLQGTVGYIPVEAGLGRFLLLPDQEQPREEKEFYTKKVSDYASRRVRLELKAANNLSSAPTAPFLPAKNPKKEPPKLVQHYLHDMESLFWIYI